MHSFLEEDVDFKLTTLIGHEEYATIEFLQGPYKGTIVIFDDIQIEQSEGQKDILRFSFGIYEGEPELNNSIEFKDYISEALTMAICNHLGEDRQPDPGEVFDNQN